MTRKYERQVKAGVMWLDDNYAGWSVVIDWESLDMGSSCCCVGGQLELEFGRFLDVNRNSIEGDKYKWARTHGFYVKDHLVEKELKLLTKEWLRHRPEGA